MQTLQEKHLLVKVITKVFSVTRSVIFSKKHMLQNLFVVAEVFTDAIMDTHYN